MSKIIKYLVAAALCFGVFKLICLPGVIGAIDTTGKPPTWLTVIAAMVALGLFVWGATKINTNK